MLGQRITIKRGGKDEEEKPFWISYSDMMTALMVLFLVVMAVALLSIPDELVNADEQRQQHRQRIMSFMKELKNTAQKKYPYVEVDVKNRIINYGERAQFAVNSSSLSQQQEAVIRAFVPVILKQASNDLGQQLLKRVLVKGYTSRTGTYLYNLHLSLKRSESVICALLSDSGPDELTQTQKHKVLQLFVVAGYSFTDTKDSRRASRRVEMQLEFYGFREPRLDKDRSWVTELGNCQI